MSFLVPADSPKVTVANAFGRELARAMQRRSVGARTLAAAVGTGRSTITNHRRGVLLPRHALAVRYAQALDWPKLVTLSLAARQKSCHHCTRTFIDDSGSSNRMYCDSRCQKAAERARKKGPPRREVRRGLALKVAELRKAVDEMCRACEPEGACRMADCPLQPVSPLPLDERRQLPVSIAGAGRKA